MVACKVRLPLLPQCEAHMAQRAHGAAIRIFCQHMCREDRAVRGSCFLAFCFRPILFLWRIFSAMSAGCRASQRLQVSFHVIHLAAGGVEKQVVRAVPSLFTLPQHYPILPLHGPIYLRPFEFLQSHLPAHVRAAYPGSFTKLVAGGGGAAAASRRAEKERAKADLAGMNRWVAGSMGGGVDGWMGGLLMLLLILLLPLLLILLL